MVDNCVPCYSSLGSSHFDHFLCHTVNDDGERLGMSMNTAMVDICLNCQVTHNLVASILVKTMSNSSLSHLASVKSIIGLNVSVISYKVR